MVLKLASKAHRMRRGLRQGFRLSLSFVLAASLAGCGVGERGASETFQIVSLYLKPGSPDELPASAAGAARLVVGESTMTGSTGCAPLQAAVTFRAPGSGPASDATPAREVARAEAEMMRINHIEFHNPGDCAGGPRFVHDALEVILSAETDYRIDRLSDTELILTKLTGEINQPSIRLMAQ